MNACQTCEQVFDRGRTPDVKIQCKLCEKEFHTSCAKITSSDFKTIKNSPNVCWFCDNCIDKSAPLSKIMCKIDDIAELVKKNAQKLESHDQVLAKLSQNNGLRFNLNSPAFASPIIEKRRYADVVAAQDNFEDGGDTRRKRRKNKETHRPAEKTARDPVLIVTKKDANDKSDVKAKVKSVLNPLNDPVKSINLSAQGKAIILCKDHESLPAMKQRLQHEMGDDVIVDVPKSVNPRVKITGVDPEYIPKLPDPIQVDGDPEIPNVPVDHAELLRIFSKQNENVFTSASTVTITNARQRKDKRYDICVSSDRETFERMLEAGKLRIGWDLCAVREDVGVLRCYKCNIYTTKHKASDCPNEISCPKCSGSHAVTLCLSNEKKCINCCRANAELQLNLPTNHCAWSSDCRVYLRHVSKKKERIRYSD